MPACRLTYPAQTADGGSRHGPAENAAVFSAGHTPLHAGHPRLRPRRSDRGYPASAFQFIKPRFDCPDIKLVATRFEADGVPYTWFVNAHDGKEYMFCRERMGAGHPGAGTPEKVKELIDWENAETAKGPYVATVEFDQLAGEPYDLVGGKKRSSHQDVVGPLCDHAEHGAIRRRLGRLDATPDRLRDAFSARGGGGEPPCPLQGNRVKPGSSHSRRDSHGVRVVRPGGPRVRRFRRTGHPRRPSRLRLDARGQRSSGPVDAGSHRISIGQASAKHC